MMKLRPVSDIHTEFYNKDEMEDLALAVLPPLPDDLETRLVLAGDIGSMHKPENLVSFIRAVAPRFKRVYQIPGNHEYYGGDLFETGGEIWRMLNEFQNVTFTPDYACHQVHISNYIMMATLWTDFDRENPLSMVMAGERMNDYRLIRCGERIARPSDTLALHREYLESFTTCMRPGDVVVTHHSPSPQSIPEEYLTDRVNGAYHSNLNYLIEEKQPAVWIHGHTHTATSYKIGRTQIICNPYGYGNQHKKNGYNPTLVVEV